METLKIELSKQETILIVEALQNTIDEHHCASNGCNFNNEEKPIIEDLIFRLTIWQI